MQQGSAHTASAALLVVMCVQAFFGLAFPKVYRDVEWIRLTWLGNDWVTLVLAVPLLLSALIGTRSGSRRALLLWLGLIGYALYNYAFYLFGAALNAFFLIYVVAVVLAIIVLIILLGHIDAPQIAGGFSSATPVRLIAGSLVFIGTGLACVWLGMWGAYVFAEQPTPVEPEAFKLVAALDLSLMVPALLGGGVLLWQKMPWGYVISAIASVQGALYLFVLSVNSSIAIHRGLTPAPGELPIWGPLAVLTTTTAVVLLAHIRSDT